MFDTLKVYLQKTLPFTDSEIQLADKYFETVFVARRDFLLTGGQISTSQKRDRQQAIAYLDSPGSEWQSWQEKSRSIENEIAQNEKSDPSSVALTFDYSLLRTSAGLLLAAFSVCDPIIMSAMSNTASRPTSSSAICTGA